jgi:hypothetical protein
VIELDPRIAAIATAEAEYGFILQVKGIVLEQCFGEVAAGTTGILDSFYF